MLVLCLLMTLNFFFFFLKLLSFIPYINTFFANLLICFTTQSSRKLKLKLMLFEKNLYSRKNSLDKYKLTKHKVLRMSKLVFYKDFISSLQTFWLDLYTNSSLVLFYLIINMSIS